MPTALTRRSIAVPHGIGNIPAYLVRPKAPGAYPGVVVIMEWWGLNEHIKDVADRFAAEGFAAIAPDLYHGKIADTSEDAAAYYGAMSMEGAVRECISCSDYLKTQPWSNGKTSMVGYCLGGTVSYLAPCRGAGVDATVAYYGNAPDPGAQLKHAECPIFGIFGADDPIIDREHVRRVRGGLRRSDLAHQVRVYRGAAHAFFNDTRPNYHERAADDAWRRTLAFLREHLA